MNPGIDIGERIRLVFKKTGWSVAYFAQQIQKDRTIAYNIFKRKIIDTSLLYDISMALNTDFFQYFSDCLAENNKLIRMEKEKKSSPHPVKKKKILLELEITEEEYGHFMNHILKDAYHTFVEFFGLRAASAEHLLPLLRHPQTSLTPHSLYSVQDAPLRAIAARGDAPLSIHFMESPGEAALFEHRGPLWEWYAKAGFSCDFLHYGSPAERLVACVPHDRRVTLVHDCCITQRDIDIVMGHFTAPVWWCLCPRSNRYISGLEPPVELLRRNRLNICLGTDSLA